MEQQVSAGWRKSTFSSGNGGACIEDPSRGVGQVAARMGLTGGLLSVGVVVPRQAPAGPGLCSVAERPPGPAALTYADCRYLYPRLV
jgi:hypothetical protein